MLYKKILESIPLSLNLNKTKYITFPNYANTQLQYRMLSIRSNLGTSEIESVDHIKYLIDRHTYTLRQTH